MITNTSRPFKIKKNKTMLLYKYSQINEYYLDSLRRKYFYCSHPSKLNDPFDCYVPIKHDERDEFIQKWININTCYTYDEEDSDFPFFTVASVKNSFKNGKFDKYVYKAFLEKDLDRFFVLSLSNEELNQLLWGTYADSYRGMCIGYKAKTFVNNSGKYYGLKIKENKFSKWRYFTSENEDNYLNVYDVDYNFLKRREYNCIASQHIFSTKYYDAIDEFIWDSLHKKKSCWQYESECRGIFHENKKGEFLGKLYYEDEILDNITFGYNTSEEAINKIKEIVYENYENADEIKFFRVKLDYTSAILTKESC